MIAHRDVCRGLVMCVVASVFAGSFCSIGPARGAPPDGPPASVRLERPDESPHPPYPTLPLAPPRVGSQPLRGPLRITQVNVDGSGANIANDAANEPSIAVDPTDPDRMVIGWRQFDTIADNFRQAGRGYSHDGGRSWTFSGVFQPGVFRSDPVLGTDAEGVFYYCSLRGDFSVHFFKSHDAGVTWGPELPAFGGDKQWFDIDRTGGMGHGHIYMSWSTAAGCCGTSIFTRSIDRAMSFSNPILIPGNPIFGTVEVAPDGNLYIIGIGSVPFDPGVFPLARSSNAQDPESSVTFDFDTTVDLGGEVVLFAANSPNPAGLLGQVWLVSDHSDGPSRGNLYVLCSVDPPGGDPLEVMFTRSTDGGVTWSPPARVNDDDPGNGAWQWFGTMSVGPTGRLDVFWNDTRNDPTATFSELYHSSSMDGGLTWSVNRPVSQPFNHFLGYPQQNKLGDYYHSLSDATGVNLAFAATFNGEQDVYHLRLNLVPGDGDGDGDVDLDDYALFNVCVTGPGGDADAGCEVFDQDLDGDVDFHDFAALQRGFTGRCAVTVTQQPTSVSTCVGEEAVFEVTATGQGLRYQWHHDWVNIPGATDARLVISSAVAESEGGYGVLVQGDCGLELSETAELSVAPLPQFVTHPGDVSACFGETASFTAQAVSGVPPLAYQWLFNGVDMTGADSPTLVVESVAPEDVGSYHCAVTDQCMVTIHSESADLVVPEVAITAQPVGGTFCVGQTVFIFVAVSDIATFQWFKDGVPIPGAVQFFLSIPNAAVEDTGAYTVEAVGQCNTVTSDEAFVEVIECADG